MADAVNKYKNSEHKCKEYLKSIQNQNRMLCSISKKSVLCLELKKIKNIKYKASKKRR